MRIILYTGAYYTVNAEFLSFDDKWKITIFRNAVSTSLNFAAYLRCGAGFEASRSGDAADL